MGAMNLRKCAIVERQAPAHSTKKNLFTFQSPLDESSGQITVSHFRGAEQVRFIASRSAAIAYPGVFAMMAIALLLAAASSTVAAPASRQSLVGTYDGHQMEIAAGLELKADGRFRYGLSYGALDEEATGKWMMSGDQVLLTSDPVTAPRFVLVSHGRAVDGVLQLSLDVPKGLSRQYFDAVIAKRNGETQRQQLGEDGLSLPFTSDNAPTSVRMLFPVFSVIGEPLNLDPSSGYSVRIRFEPNDLGKVNFQATPLTVLNGDLLFDRHGRTIRFKHSKP
jgi:hypothetical protein